MVNRDLGRRERKFVRSIALGALPATALVVSALALTDVDVCLTTMLAAVDASPTMIMAAVGNNPATTLGR